MGGVWIFSGTTQFAICCGIQASEFLYLHSISVLLLIAFTVFLSNSSSYCSLLLSRKSEESSKKSDSASSDSDLPPEYLNSPLSRETQVGILLICFSMEALISNPTKCLQCNNIILKYQIIIIIKVHEEPVSFLIFLKLTDYNNYNVVLT